MKYTDRIEKAIKVASHAHRNQTRKGTDIPYVSHLFSVMTILSEYTEDEDLLIAGLLHDMLEDTNLEEYSVSNIEAEFGQRVLAIIQDVSEKKNAGMQSKEEKETWKNRKDLYLHHLEKASEDALLVSSADKLHNLLSTIEDFNKDGDALWNRFNASKNDQLWFYKEFSNVLIRRLPKHPLAERVSSTVKELEKITAEA